MEQKKFVPIQVITEAPKSNLLVFAVNDHLQIYDSKHQTLIHSKELQVRGHTSAVRAIEFSSDEQQMVTCGDDKLVKVWDCKNWTLIAERKGLKKLSNAIFANFPGSKQDSKVTTENAIVFSDKFGDVFVFHFRDDSSTPTLILGHCSIVTSMLLSPNKKYLISSDKDEKIRVSLFPNAYEIQSFCLGHTSIVTKLCIPSSHSQLLISGGGDLTLRLWNYIDGKLLHTLAFEDLKDSKAIVAGISHTSVHNLIAVLFEGQPIVYLVRIAKDEKSLHLETKIHLEKTIVPLNLMFDSHGNLYVVGANPLWQILKYDSSTKGFVASSESTQFIKEVTKEVNDAKAYKDLMDNISLRQLRKKSDENPTQNKKRKVDDDS